MRNSHRIAGAAVLACAMFGGVPGADAAGRGTPAQARASQPVVRQTPPPPGRAAHGQTGKASWYATGRLTANGERFNPEGLSAAHPSLPFGTRVLVENPRNGRSVILRINDRGPFVKGRMIDVSKGAARELGMLSSGVTPVTMSVVGHGALRKAPSPPRRPVDLAAGED